MDYDCNQGVLRKVTLSSTMSFLILKVDLHFTLDFFITANHKEVAIIKVCEIVRNKL